MSMNYGAPPGMPVQAQPPAAPPPKKGLSTGCIVGIVAVLLFFVCGGGLTLFAGYAVSQNKDVQNVMGAIGDMAAIMAEGQAAPGTNELRALGCETAIALDAAKMQKIGTGFLDAGAPPPPPDVDRIVMCQVSAFGTPPTCDTAALAYVTGAAPTRKFMLTVSAHKKTSCSGIYSPTGVLLSTPRTGRGP